MKSEKENKAFDGMYKSALIRLENRQPEEIAKNTGVEYLEEESIFKLKSLDKTIELKYPEYRAKKKLDEWLMLLLLHYLDLGDGTVLQSKPVHFGELKDGLIRGARFDKTAEKELENFLLNKTEEEVINVFKSLGGKIIDSKFDLSAEFELFPNYIITINIWFKDEEFEATGQMLVDKSADSYLTIEDSVVAGEFMLGTIKSRYDKLYKNL